jgi:hypothetical protein
VDAAAEWRSARAGLRGLAVFYGLAVALRIVDRVVVSLLTSALRSSETPTQLFRVLDVVGWAYVALAIAVLPFWWMLARVPAHTRARGWAVAGLSASGLALVVEGGVRAVAMLNVHPPERVYTAIWVSFVFIDAVRMAALLVVIARAAKVPRGLLVAIATLFGLVSAKSLLFDLVSIHDELTALHVTFDVVAVAQAGLLVVALVLASRALGRAAESEAVPSPEAAAISTAWRPVADGIGLYIGGACARVVILVTGYAFTFASAQARDLSGAQGAAVTFAIMGGLAALVMMAGVWNVARAPGHVAGPGAITALVMMVLGLLLDGYALSLTYAMFSGSLSAVFEAMDQLPYVTVFAAGLGIVAAASLLGAFAAIASSLELPEEAQRARTVRVIVVVVGGGAALLQLGASKVPAEALIPLALAVFVVAISALVMFLRVLLAISRSIRARSAAAA